MSFQDLATKVTVSAVFTAGVAASSPVQALTLSGGISLSGGGNVVANTVTFNNAVVDTGSGDFSSLVGQTGVTVSPLNFASTVNTNPSVTSRTTLGATPFINFGSFTKGATVGNLTFNLDPSSVTTILSPVGTAHFSNPDIRGKFWLDDKLVAFGQGFLSASNTSSGGSYSISLKAVPVPTPALLPGLIGMGVAALRKKRSCADQDLPTSEV
jgi:hypothetical protein